MRHERDCTCDLCRPAPSLSDSILTGVLTITVVAFAIMSGSLAIMATVAALLIAVIAFKIGAPLRRSGRQGGGK